MRADGQSVMSGNRRSQRPRAAARHPVNCKWRLRKAGSHGGRNPFPLRKLFERRALRIRYHRSLGDNGSAASLRLAPDPAIRLDAVSAPLVLSPWLLAVTLPRSLATRGPAGHPQAACGIVPMEIRLPQNARLCARKAERNLSGRGSKGEQDKGEAGQG